MSKKEIRRAARDAFPKAKGASSAKGRSGAYSKRTYQAKPRGAASGGRTTTGGRAVPRPPSIKRSVIFGAVAAVLYFAFIQWLLPRMIKMQESSIVSNLVVSGAGLLLFAAVNYMTDRFRYRRYLRKKDGSGK